MHFLSLGKLMCVHNVVIIEVVRDSEYLLNNDNVVEVNMVECEK